MAENQVTLHFHLCSKKKKKQQKYCSAILVWFTKPWIYEINQLKRLWRASWRGGKLKGLLNGSVHRGANRCVLQWCDLFVVSY